MSSDSTAFITDLYASWTKRPDSVGPFYAGFFQALNAEARAVLEAQIAAAHENGVNYDGDSEDAISAMGKSIFPDFAVNVPLPRGTAVPAGVSYKEPAR